MIAEGLVDVHAHFTSPRYVESAKTGGHSRPDGMPEAYWPRWLVEEHLDFMDAAGISRAVLSLSSPGVHFGDDKRARSLAREVNEFGAEAVREHPG